jgi:hypothetical protein
MQHQKRLLFIAVSLSLPLMLAGCAGDLESPQRFDALLGDCPDIQETVIAKDCAKSNCHKAPNLMGKLDLSAPDIVTQLSGKAATGGPGLLIDPTHPAESVLYTKITANPPFGAQMPFATTKLDEGTQACFLSWIESSVKGTP